MTNDDSLAPPAMASSIHIGRQPIYDTTLTIVGHELLFRAQPTSTTSGQSPGDEATTTVMLNAFTAFGADHLVGEGLAFVNLTRAFVVGELPLPLTPALAVLEVLETVEVDDEVFDGVMRLIAQGFTIALDDFLWTQSDRVRLLPHARYVKVDIDQVDPVDLPVTVERLRRYDALLVAEHVETVEDLERCRALGFDLFQGYYLMRPQVLTAVAPSAGQESCIRLLGELADPALSFESIEALVRVNPGLAVRVLQAANAASSGLRRPLRSVRQALIMLGVERLRGWVILMVAADAGFSDPARLALILTRARMCELLAPSWGVATDTAFTAGLLSELDLLLGVPQDELLRRLGLSPELHEALVSSTGPLGELIRDVRRYESEPAWSSSPDAPPLAEAYLAAIAWATTALPIVATGSPGGP